MSSCKFRGSVLLSKSTSLGQGVVSLNFCYAESQHKAPTHEALSAAVVVAIVVYVVVVVAESSIVVVLVVVVEVVVVVVVVE